MCPVIGYDQTSLGALCSTIAKLAVELPDSRNSEWCVVKVTKIKLRQLNFDPQ